MASYGTPPVTAEKLIAVLTEQRVVDPSTLPVPARGSVVALERHLIDQGALTDDQLGLLKGFAAGRQVVDVEQAQVDTSLPIELVKRAGALRLQGDPATVVFVEDAEPNRTAVAAEVGDGFDVQLATLSQFNALRKAAYQHQASDNRTAVSCIEDLYHEMIRRAASDLHLHADKPPFMRIDDRLTELPYQPVSGDWILSELERRRAHGAGRDPVPGELLSQMEQAGWSLDFSDRARGLNLRLNVGRTKHGPSAAIRMLPATPPSIDELALPRAVRDVTGLSQGLVVVTGPTGSGKSTTLAAVMQQIANTQSRHILTLEDPIEYHLDDRGPALISQNELGRDFRDFPHALRAALRQDPDVILVGEMRDRETMTTAIAAAETGHLVLSTVHTHDAPSTVDRIISTFPEAQQADARARLSYVLQVVVSQTLLRRAGKAGRVAAFEVLTGTTGVRNNLSSVEGVKQLHNEMETGERHGMQTLEKSLARLVAGNTVRKEDAELRARRRDSFEQHLRHLQQTST